MSVVNLHIGQCGIQLGEHVWLKSVKIAEDDVNHQHVIIQRNGQPRGLFVDSEKKVIRRFARKMKATKMKCKFNVLENSIQSRMGCGSNWSLGHNRLSSMKIMGDVPNLKTGFGQIYLDPDSSMLQTCLDSVRLKIEACESFSGFLGFQSLAGGTGSGFGSRLCQELRDSYPTAYRLWNVVTPFSLGESPTQSYNQLLSMTSLYQNSDAILLLDNDAALEQLSQTATSVSLHDINDYFSNAILGLYSPTDSLTPPGGGFSIGMEPWEMCRSLAAMPSLKLLKCRHAKETSQSHVNVWEKLSRSLLSQVKKDALDGSCISSLFVCRGRDYLSIDWKRKLRGKLKFVEWNPYPVDTWEGHKHKNRNLTFCGNLTSAGTHFCQNVIEKSKKMFESRAYLHWYERYGTVDEHFRDAFDVMNQIVDCYMEAKS